MKKYLEDLRQELKKQNLTNEEIEEIISDHEEMIQTAMAEGLSEDEIKAKFGKPAQLAEELADFEPKENAEQDKIDGYKLFKSFEISKDELMVEVKLVSEDVIYQASENATINIYYRGKGKIDRYDIDYKQGKLVLMNEKNLTFGLSFGKKNDMDFIVEIPKTKIIAEFTHRSVSSDVELKNLEIKQFKLSTTSGDLDIKNSKLGNAEWHTVSGDINIEASSMDELDSSQVSGDLNLEKVTFKGDVRCNTVSGDVNIEASECKIFDFNSVSGDMNGEEFYPKAVSLKSVSGDITIKNMKDHHIQVGRKRSISGDITINN